MIPCPHCQWNTVLTVAGKPTVEIGGGASFQKRVFMGFGVFAVLVVAAAMAALLWMKHAAPDAKPVSQSAPASNNISSAAGAKPVPEPDPWHGLKAGKISLEKSGEGRVVHAVGSVTNTSDRQRFGVKVELDVFDAQGKKLGSATDYTQVIEPEKEWKFKALVTDRKAENARLIAIKEQD